MTKIIALYIIIIIIISILEQYNKAIEMFTTTPSWSMPRKYEPAKLQQTPSPDVYHPDKWSSTHSPSWKIGNDTRNKQNNDQKPGPGQYHTLLKKQTKLGKFGKQNRIKCDQNLNPAPNAYSPNYLKNRPASPYSTISAKPKPQKIDNTPGPGQYQSTYQTKSRPLSGKMSVQKRFLTEKTQNPSPQAYCPNMDKFKKIYTSFGRASKKSSTHMNMTTFECNSPGPGSYNANQTFANTFSCNRGYSMSSKHKQAAVNDSPGPGQYNPVYVSHPQDPKVSFKGKHESYKIENTPGPAQYFEKANQSNKRQGGFSIGRSQRLKTDNYRTSPGPGAYNPKTVFTQTPKYSLCVSRVQEQKSFSPGPGAYNPNKDLVKTRPHSAKFGKSKRCELDSSISPGPGAYMSSTNPIPSTSFTRQARVKRDKQKTPGPGDYEIRQIIGSTQSYYSKN